MPAFSSPQPQCPTLAQLLAAGCSRTWPGCLAAATLALLAGCASPGNPRAPSLHLQQTADSLTARRVGDQVTLAWTTPDTTTDGGRSIPPLTASVCRKLASPAHGPCTPVLRVATVPGPNEVADTLPPALRTSLALLEYRVAILNGRGRSAGLSAPAFAAAGPALPPMGPLTLSARPGGTLVAWASGGSPAAVQLTRTPAQVAGIQVGSPPASKPDRSRTLASSDPSQPVVFRAAPVPGNGSGMLDRTVLDPRLEGIAFRYVAQRTQTVTLEGHDLEIAGLPSPPAFFTYVYSFPPDVPTGLIAIPSLAPPSIDLSWEASATAGLLGYQIYRSDASGAAFSLLTPQPVPVPSFRDLTAQPGRTYRYRVTAVDRHHNQSAPSDEVRETLSQ